MNVSVTGQQGADGSLSWTINGASAGNSQLQFAKGAGAQVLRFILDDQTGQGLQFDQSDAFWAAKDSGGCPPSGSSCDQTTVLSCNGNQLVVRNENSGPPSTVHYQLNLIDGNNQPVRVDPIIKNGGSA